MHAIRAGAVLRHRGELDRRHARSPRRWRASRDAAQARRSPASGSSSPAAGPSSSSRRSAGRRRPSSLAAAPDHPVYVQLFYSARAAHARRASRRSASPSDADVPPRGKIERDADGKPTGWIAGDNRDHQRPVRPAAAADLRRRRSRARAQFFRELNRLGITGVIDPGGYNLTVAELPAAVPGLARPRAHACACVYSLCAPRRGQELEDFQALTQMLPMGFGDDWLRFNGIGENVTWGMYNNDNADRGAEGAALPRCCAGRRRAA